MTILIVGGGKMGLSHLAIANRIIGPGQVALCDSSRATRFLFRQLNFKTHTSVEAAFQADPGIRGVVIATPTSSHFPIARAVLERSVPCFIEKPLTLNVARSRELVQLAASKGVDAQMGFVLRYVSTFSRLRDMVRSGALGPVRSYQARMNGSVITRPDTTSWRTNFAAGGGCLNEYGPHLIDLCRFIFGEVDTLLSASKGHVHSTNADDRIQCGWRHSGGASGELSLDWCDTTKRKSVIQFVAEFEHGQVTADNSALRVVFSDIAPLSPQLRAELSTQPMPPRVSFYLRGEEYTLQLEDFLERCMNRTYRVDDQFGIGNRAMVADGLAVDTLIDAIATKVGLQ